MIDTVEIWECINVAVEIHGHTWQHRSVQQNERGDKGGIWDRDGGEYATTAYPLLRVIQKHTQMLCCALEMIPQRKFSSCCTCLAAPTNEVCIIAQKYLPLCLLLPNNKADKKNMETSGLLCSSVV